MAGEATVIMQFDALAADLAAVAGESALIDLTRSRVVDPCSFGGAHFAVEERRELQARMDAKMAADAAAEAGAEQ